MLSHDDIGFALKTLSVESDTDPVRTPTAIVVPVQSHHRPLTVQATPFIVRVRSTVPFTAVILFQPMCQLGHPDTYSMLLRKKNKKLYDQISHKLLKLLLKTESLAHTYRMLSPGRCVSVMVLVLPGRNEALMWDWKQRTRVQGHSLRLSC